MKTYVIIVSRYFPKTHPAKGEPTYFVDSILKRIKTTTIRGNYWYWRKIVREVNAGKAVLSIRYWTASPYNYQRDGSKQKEFARCTKVEIHKLEIKRQPNILIFKNGVCMHHKKVEELIIKEGFRKPDHFYDWFPQEEFSGIMLEFLQIEKITNK